MKWTPAEIVRAAALVGLFALFGVSLWLAKGMGEHNEALTLLFGSVSTSLGLAIGYYFGASAHRDDGRPTGTAEDPVLVAAPPGEPVTVTDAE